MHCSSGGVLAVFFLQSGFRNPKSHSPKSAISSFHEAPPKIHGRIQKMEIFWARDFDGAEFLQVWRKPLRVEECEAPLTQPFHEREKRNLGRIPDMMKHRFGFRNSPFAQSARECAECEIYRAAESRADRGKTIRSPRHPLPWETRQAGTLEARPRDQSWEFECKMHSSFVIPGSCIEPSVPLFSMLESPLRRHLHRERDAGRWLRGSVGKTAHARSGRKIPARDNRAWNSRPDRSFR